MWFTHETNNTFVSLCSPAKISPTSSSSKTFSSTNSADGSTASSASVPARPTLRRASSGPRDGGGNKSSSSPSEPPSSPTSSPHLPPLLELPAAGYLQNPPSFRQNPARVPSGQHLHLRFPSQVTTWMCTYRSRVILGTLFYSRGGTCTSWWC